MPGGQGADDIEALAEELESKLSQESSEIEAAEAIRSQSDTEDDLELESESQCWWVQRLMQSTEREALPDAAQPVKVISACSGACAEGHVLQAIRILFQIGPNLFFFKDQLEDFIDFGWNRNVSGETFSISALHGVGMGRHLFIWL